MSNNNLPDLGNTNEVDNNYDHVSINKNILWGLYQ